VLQRPAEIEMRKIAAGAPSMNRKSVHVPQKSRAGPGGPSSYRGVVATTKLSATASPGLFSRRL
jgi:hypothetical protein